MNKNEDIKGFKLLEKKDLRDINSIGMLFEHEKTGARVFYVKNDDDNKVFQIAFRTPPINSTGLTHILEHSVFCGSRKFKTKEPFVDLMKSSLNTFLNAMTFSDKTVYPIASKNDKDFMNLIDVYLDSVFYPAIYEHPEILMQEGWHYELKNKDDEIKYKGVVYNEMKGAMSSPETLLYIKSKEFLYPDTSYKFNSGGDPDFIPDLKYNEFIEYHRKYYHPSNSYIFIYGNGDMNKLLNFIDTEYLSKYDKRNIESCIGIQRPFSSVKEFEVEYPISSEETTEDKTYLSLSFAAGDALDEKLSLALRILEHMLLDTPAAPLRRALIASGICKDVYGSFQGEMRQPQITIVAKNSNIDSKEKFKKIVYDSLRDIVKKGIDKRLIEASINVNEFMLREANENGVPRGLYYGIYCMNSWLHNGNPMSYIMYGDILKDIRKDAETGYFEKLINDYILGNNHGVVVILKPSKEISKKKDENLNKKLKEIKDRLSNKEIDDLIDSNINLKTRQETPDSKADMETIPHIAISDIEKNATRIPVENININGIDVLYNRVATNGIGYINILFDIRTIDIMDIKYVALMSDILGMVNTAKYSYEELSNEININIGGLAFYTNVYEDIKNPKNIYPKFIIKAKSLTPNISDMFNILSEILANTSFKDKNRIKEILHEKKSQMEMVILNSGDSVAYKRLISHFSPKVKLIEQLTGIDYYRFICNILDNFDTESENTINKLEYIYKSIFNRNNLIISFTGLDDELSQFKESIDSLTNSLMDSKIELKDYDIDTSKNNEGILTPSDVQYVVKGYNINNLGLKYTGKMLVLKTILSLDYLWKNVRVMGGAYGGYARIERNGNIIFASYRDPNLKKTLDIYNSSPEFIRNFTANEEDMTRYIIGTIQKLDYPIHPSLLGDVAVAQNLSNISYDDIQLERQEILSTNYEDIRSFADTIHLVMKKDYYCVLGNEINVKKEQNLFDSLISLFK